MSTRSPVSLESLEGRTLFAGVFQESGGLAVAEIESAPTNGWTKVTSPSGYTGSAAYKWNGANNFNSPGKNVLKYDFNINNAGTYNLDLRSYNASSDNKEFNDVFIRVDGGTWFKAFTFENKKWTYVTRKEVRHGVFEDYRVNLSKGTHSVEISTRSAGYTIDRLVLSKDGVNGQNPALPQSPTSGSNPNPNPNPQPTSKLKVTSYSLIDADTNQVISGYSNITSDRTIDLSNLPTRNINIRANVESNVQSVKFNLDGRTARVESEKPFALFGDSNSNYNAWRPTAGKTYSLSAIGYSQDGATGNAGANLSVKLKFVA